MFWFRPFGSGKSWSFRGQFAFCTFKFLFWEVCQKCVTTFFLNFSGKVSKSRLNLNHDVWDYQNKWWFFQHLSHFPFSPHSPHWLSAQQFYTTPLFNFANKLKQILYSSWCWGLLNFIKGKVLNLNVWSRMVHLTPDIPGVCEGPTGHVRQAGTQTQQEACLR